MSSHSRRGGDHDDEGHGGQWKVAYADFVTAMMAFFLIMWLVSSATETERAVIAKYFNNTSLFNLPGGTGVLNGGRSVIDGSEAKSPRLQPSTGGGKARQEVPPSQHTDDVANAAPAVSQASLDRVERQRFEAMKAEIERMMQQGELKELASNLLLETTPDGLRIQIFDRDGEAMFQPGSAEPTPRLALILTVISEVLQTVQNSVILAGHTDAQPLQRGDYSNWELSADRANAVRRQLEADGLATTRFIRVEGRAASDLLLPQSPDDPRNRRIAVTVLRSDLDAPVDQPP